MCLSTITKKYEKPVRRVVKAYKRFDNFGSQKPVEFMHQQYNGSYSVVFDEWLLAQERELSREDFLDVQYTSGFHCYTRPYKSSPKYDTISWPVYQYEVTTRGMQDGLVVSVSRYLYIPSDPAAPAPKFPVAMLRASAKKGA